MGRRGNNEGSIYQRESDGKWVGSVSVDYGLSGKRRRKTVYGKTRKEVSAKLKILLRDQQRGLPIIIERSTVGEFLDKWLENSVKPTVRPRTYASYSDMVRLHIAPALGRYQLTKLEPQQVQVFLGAKLDTGLSPRTVQYCHAILHRALGQAYKWGLVPRNVASLVDPPRVTRPEVQPLTPDQARQFLASVKGDRLEGLFTILLTLGLRRGEALGLKWSDVNLDKKTLVVRASLQRIEGKLTLSETKTDRSHRTLHLPGLTMAALKAHKIRQLEDRLLAGDRWQDSGLVFTSTVGTPLDPRNINRRFQKALERAGLGHIRLHDLRHSAASLLISQGVHPRAVMEALGHSQISLTMNLYGHVYEQGEEEVANTMDRALTGND
jgi:integrase